MHVMGKFFFNKHLNVNNALEVDLNIDKLKEFEIIKKSYLWGTNKDIFPSEKFTSLRPNWGGDLEWISANNIETYNLFFKAFRKTGLNELLKDTIEYKNQLRLYAGFFLKRSSSKKNFHMDWNAQLENNAFTLLTPLYQEDDALHLIYMDISGKECKYEYEVGKGIVFGSEFNHSTEAGKSLNASILLCFQFGTDLEKFNSGIHSAMGTQTPFMILPDGRYITNKKNKPKITTYSVPWGANDIQF